MKSNISNSMKKSVVFLLGFITGAVVAIVVLGIIGIKSNKGPEFFDTPGEVINVNTFEVFQSFDNGTALAREDDDYPHDLIVLLWNSEGKPYYDNQKLSAGKDECFRQVGIYKYASNGGGMKTVPIVALFNKR